MLFRWNAFTVFLLMAAAAAARAEKSYDTMAMADLDLTPEDYDELLRNPDVKLEELHRLSRECQSEEPDVELLSGERTKREKNARSIADSDEALKRNDLMRQMNHFFGGVETYSANDPNNPSFAMQNAMNKAFANLDDEEREIFRSMMGAIMAAVAMLVVWLVGCLSICLCGYETVMTKYVPCCGCMIRAFCWPAICCCEVGVKGARGTCRVARSVCGRCRAHWRRRPWRAAPKNKLQ